MSFYKGLSTPVLSVGSVAATGAISAGSVSSTGTVAANQLNLAPRVTRPAATQGNVIYRDVGYLESFDGTRWDSAVEKEQFWNFDMSTNHTFAFNTQTEFAPAQIILQPPGVTPYFTIAPQSGSTFTNTNAIVVPPDFEGVLTIVLRGVLRNGNDSAANNVSFRIQACNSTKNTLTNASNIGLGQGITGVSLLDLPALGPTSGFDVPVIFPPIRLTYDSTTPTSFRRISFLATNVNNAPGIVWVGSSVGTFCSLTTSPA
jgi:hypothetical protein